MKQEIVIKDGKYFVRITDVIHNLSVDIQVETSDDARALMYDYDKCRELYKAKASS